MYHPTWPHLDFDSLELGLGSRVSKSSRLDWCPADPHACLLPSESWGSTCYACVFTRVLENELRLVEQAYYQWLSLHPLSWVLTLLIIVRTGPPKKKGWRCGFIRVFHNLTSFSKNVLPEGRDYIVSGHFASDRYLQGPN